MLTPALRTILERAANEAGFREQLLSKPDEALAEYSLTAEEATALHSLSSQQLEQLASELTDEALDKVTGGDVYNLIENQPTGINYTGFHGPVGQIHG